MNIVSLAMNFLTPAIVSRIASALGIESSFAQKAIAAALPTILGGIISKASNPSGLGALAGVLAKQDPGMLGNLGSIFGGPNQAATVDAGTNALGSLFGNSTVGTLAGAISKYSGVGQAQSSSLLGMLAPVALGTLAQQQKASGLDINGLANMLRGQKDNVSAALPAGFGDLLKGTGLLDGVMPSAPKVAPSAPYVAPAAPSSSGLMKWLPWAAAAVVALVGWNLLSSMNTPSVPAVPKVVYNNVDVGSQAASIYEGLKTSIGGIKDDASARAQLPKLQEFATRIGQLETTQKQMPADAKKSLGAIIGGYVPALRSLITTALNAAGVSPIVKPILDQILDRMEAMAKA